MYAHHFGPNRTELSGATQRLSDEVYAAALDGVVISCADVIVVDSENGTMLSGYRQQKPQEGWWVSCGGRIIRGDSPSEAGAAKLKEELGLDVSAESLAVVGIYSTSFADRQLPPQENGTHTLNALLVYEVTPEQRQEIQSTMRLNKEHARAEWLPLEEIIDPETSQYSPALKIMAENTLDYLTTPPDLSAIDPHEAAFRSLCTAIYWRQAAIKTEA